MDAGALYTIDPARQRPRSLLPGATLKRESSAECERTGGDGSERSGAASAGRCRERGECAQASGGDATGIAPAHAGAAGLDRAGWAALHAAILPSAWSGR
jgi:hypothetical protein